MSSHPGPRILVIVESLPLGVDQRVKKQVDSLLEAGHRVTVICRRSSSNDSYRNRDGLRLMEHPSPPQLAGKLGFLVEYATSWLMAAVLTLIAYCRGGFDAIQACCPPDVYFLLAYPFKLRGIKLVVDQRDLSPEVFAERYGRDKGILAAVLLRLERASYRSADHVVCVNESLRHVVLDRGGKRPEQVSVVGNGPILASLPKLLPPSPVEGGELFCCWLGVTGPQDHVDLFIRMAENLIHRQGRRDCHFLIIGAGESLASLVELVDNLDLREWMTFTGWLDQKGMYDHLARADLGVDTNLQEEVTPVKAMEYMAFRLPFVAFDLRETRLLGGDAALYAPRGDADVMADLVAELLDDPVRKRHMGAVGRRRIEEMFSWELQRKPYLAVYERLLGNRESAEFPSPS